MPPGRLEGTYYTDPLCSWSWAFEAPWRRLRRSLGDRLAVRTAMGGLLPDWRSFSDSVNDIHRPAQMAPAWISVAELSGMPIDEAVWRDDPPASSYPACLAVKAAERQSAAGGALYLRRLREAVMLDRRNIARRDVLLEIAGELARDAPRALDLARFTRDLAGEAAGALFRDDLKEARYLGISRFPTLVLGRPGGRSAALVGYRPGAPSPRPSPRWRPSSSRWSPSRRPPIRSTTPSGGASRRARRRKEPASTPARPSAGWAKRPKPGASAAPAISSSPPSSPSRRSTRRRPRPSAPPAPDVGCPAGRLQHLLPSSAPKACFKDTACG